MAYHNAVFSQIVKNQSREPLEKLASDDNLLAETAKKEESHSFLMLNFVCAPNQKEPVNESIARGIIAVLAEHSSRFPLS